MLARRRQGGQRRGPAAATGAAQTGAAAGGHGGVALSEGTPAATAIAGAVGHVASSSSKAGDVNRVIEERLAAFAPFVLPSLINENKLDVAGAASGEDMGEGLMDGAMLGITGSGGAGLSTSLDAFSGSLAGAPPHPHHAIRVSQAVLLMYLHIGGDPPDFPRIKPCAKMECWIDPMVAHVSQYAPNRRRGSSGGDSIAEALEQQYRTLLRDDAVVIRVSEASIDTARVMLGKTRRSAREDRVLVHYNGHGMPRATGIGEVWMFDKEKTHYVPLHILELATLVGTPTLYVFDCNAAGAILDAWHQMRHAERRPHDLFICACAANETLPLNPRLPADMLTACLTTPLRMALEWYINFSHYQVLLPDVTEDMIRNMPGTLTDRRSPRGELHWVLGAITTTIAWCTLPAQQFHALFRHDSTTKAMFRNAILADRLMREAGCTPVTHPKFSETAHLHPLWELWEYTLERAVSQLPRLSSAAAPTASSPTGGKSKERSDASEDDAARAASAAVPPPHGSAGNSATASVAEASGGGGGSTGQPVHGRAPRRTAAAVYEPSTFLNDQLTAFSVWVHSGDMSQLPEQLPCALLALAQSTHQVRAFTLLAKYLDAGRTAGKRAILCGIMPYLSQLLSKAPRAFLIVTVLWMQVIRADPVEVCAEMQRTQCEKYFTSLLKLSDAQTKIVPVEYGESVDSSSPASPGATTGGSAKRAASSPQRAPLSQPQHPPPPAAASPLSVVPRALYRNESRPAVFSAISLDAAESSTGDPAGRSQDAPPQPLQPVTGSASSLMAVRVDSAPQLNTIANHAVQAAGDTEYYLMKDVDLPRCKSMACYILCQYQLRGERQCLLCWNNRLLNAAFPNLSSPNAELRSWSCLVLSKLFSGLRHAKSFASRECASRLDLFTRLLLDRSPLVRSSCVTLLATIVGIRMDVLPEDQQVRRLQLEKSLLIKLRGYVFDASMSVREELIFFASQILSAYRNALPPAHVRQVHEFVAEVGQSSPTWQLTEADVAVKSLLNTARPTVNTLFDDAIVFETTFLTADDPLPSSREMDPKKLVPKALEIMQGLLHDAALMLCTLYRNCDSANVNKALRTLSMGEAPQSQRFASEALRTMSHVASLDSSHYLSEADRTRMTWNADMMRQLVLDMRGRKLEPHQAKSTIAAASPPPQAEASAPAVAGSNGVSSDAAGSATGPSPAAPHMRRPASSSANALSASSATGQRGATFQLPPDSNTAARYQVLPSTVESDTVVCTTFRALEASMVVATKNQKIHYISYDSYNVQSVVNSFSVRLSGPIHDVLVINDLSEQSGLLIATKRGSFSLMKGCWERESIPTEAAVFSACPPPPPNTWLDIKSAYRPSTATLFYGGAIGDGDGAGQTEIHVLSLAEEQVTQRLEVSGNPTLTGLVAHTTQRSLFAGFADGVVRYYDDRQRQGQMGTVGMMSCRHAGASGAGGSADAVVGLGVMVPEGRGDAHGHGAGGSGGAPFTLAAATRTALYMFDARRLNEPALVVSHTDLYNGAGTPTALVPSTAGGAGSAPFLTNCSVGAHTGLVALSFSDGTYSAYNAKGLILNEHPMTVVAYKQQQTQPPPQRLPPPLPTGCVAHPLRPLMSFAGDLMFLQL